MRHAVFSAHDGVVQALACGSLVGTSLKGKGL